MDFLPPLLLTYCEAHSEAEPELLRQLNRDTHLKVSSARMLSGHLQGRILKMLAQLISAENILEIGTYTGYSALCMAEALPSHGLVTTIDPNEETNFFAMKYFAASEHGNKVKLIEGQALQIIPTLDQTFDLIFIDADKRRYFQYFEICIDKVRKGGVIVVDNVLWSGKVIDENAQDADTVSIRAFNDAVCSDPRVEPLLLPVRDGLLLLRRL